MGLTIDDVLRDLPRAPATTKVAGLGGGPLTYGILTKKLAELVRAVPEPEISWASLYAVKEAGYRSAPPQTWLPEPEIDEATAGAPLRKLAHALREQDNERAAAFFEKNAAAIRAVRGLTLLRERTAK